MEILVRKEKRQSKPWLTSHFQTSVQSQRKVGVNVKVSVWES